MIEAAMDLSHSLQKARRSAWARWWLNAGLRWMIPFNRPHGFRVVPLDNGGIRVLIPFRRANRNHIKGIHACCLATGAELCSGLALMGMLDPGRYRIIMQELRVEYHFQAKMEAQAEFSPAPEELQAGLLQPLAAGGPVLYVARVPVHDVQGNHLATAEVKWQVKAWDQVRTRR